MTKIFNRTVTDSLDELFKEWKRLNPDAPVVEFQDFLNTYVFPFVELEVNKHLSKKKQ